MKNFFVNSLPDAPIQNVIFDLGGVIMHLDMNRTVEAFNKLGIKDIVLTHNTTELKAIFQEYEIGKISSSEFRQRVCASSNISLTPEQFDAAWNEMLVEIPEERIDFLANMGAHFRTFLLSNTNEIHLNHVNQYLKESFGIDDFSALFEDEYYSHQLKMRKPDVKIFAAVCTESDLIPEETLFIDDVEANVKAACEAGMYGVHLVAPATIEEVLAELLN
jgi:putative hydrolase of the HAD superfamily